MVADHSPYHSPVLLFHVRAVVAVARPGARERDRAPLAPVEQVVVDELATVVGIDPEDWERHDLRDLCQGRDDPFAGLVAHAAVLGPTSCNIGNGQGVAVLTKRVTALVADQIDLEETRNRVVPLSPGTDRDLIFEQRPGFGVRRPLPTIFARSGANRRSMVAGDIVTNAVATSSVTSSSAKRRNVGTSSAIIGASRFPVGPPSTAQQNPRATTVFVSYNGARALRAGTTIFGFNAAANAFRAWLRCHPVVAHNSSRIAPLAALSPRLYRVAIALVTARRWLIVSPMFGAYRLTPSRPGRRAQRAHSYMSQRTPTRAHFR